MIHVYASRLHPDKETYQTSTAQSLLSWLHQNGISPETRLDMLPMSLYLNGDRLVPSQWSKTVFRPDDLVEIYREPKGTDPFSITFALIFGAAAVLKALTPKIPTVGGNSRDQGDPLNEANAKGNSVKLNDVIPELAGFNPERFPDYAAPPRRYFAGPYEQRIEMNLVVGRGRYQIAPSKVKVGATPMLALGDDARFHIYEPGQDMSGDPAHLYWYTANEVGASSNGSAGLELTATTALTPSANASAYQFAGNAISIPAGVGAFPADWDAGIVLKVQAPYVYSVIDGGLDRDIVRGPLWMLSPVPGMRIEVAGANAGVYVVNSYRPYVPAIPATPGTPSTLTGSAAPARYDFNTTSLTFTLSRSGTAYPVTLNTATTNLDGLITALNTKLSETPFAAISSGGRVRFVEQSPYNGQAISASGASTIIGSAPVGTIGTATTSGAPEQPAEMTLSYDSGAPVTGLALGEGLATIGPRGLRYRILGFSASLMTVERLTAGGDVDSSWPGFDNMQTVNGAINLDPSNLEGGYRGPFPACPEGELITAIEFDVMYPSGLIFLGAKGERWPLEGYTQFEYRDMNGPGAWVSAEFSQSAATLDAVGYTHRIDLPYPMRPECRHKKLLVNQGGNRDTEYFDKVMWLTLKGLMQGSSRTSFPGVTMLTADIRGGDRISSQTENKVSVECTRILPVLRNGVWQPEQPTREISAWIGHVARDVGYSDTQDIDIAELERLESTYWTPRGDAYDKIIDSPDTVKGSMIEALNAGFAELSIDRGVLVPVRDGPRGSAFDAVYNPQVMTDDLELSFNGPDLPDEYDGVDVEYYDHRTRQNEVVPCRLPGDAGSRISKLKLEGVTERNRVWRWGMRERRKLQYRRKSFTFNTELDALNSGYGDYVALGVSVSGYGQSAEVNAYATLGDGSRLIGSTEPLDWSLPGTYKVVLRRRDGSASGPYVATFVSEYQFTIPTLDFEPDMTGETEPPIIQFGHESRWCHPALITSVKPRGTKACAVEAEIYDERVYADDNNFAPA
jgi:hypothetical protein